MTSLQNTKITHKCYQTYTLLFDWSSVNHSRSPYGDPYSPDFLEWFVGFSEGDGSFHTSKNGTISFLLKQADLAVLEKIRAHLGFGSITTKTHFPHIKVFRVYRRDFLKIEISLFNVNLLLKKTTVQFSRWVHQYNTLTGDTVKVISRHDNRSPFLSQIQVFGKG
jgi:hypothetical protein